MAALKAALCKLRTHYLLTKLGLLGTMRDGAPMFQFPTDARMTLQHASSQITKMTLSVFFFVSFVFTVDVGQAEAGCGDYLNHTVKRVLSDTTPNSQPEPFCSGGNCRSAPNLPPAEPSRIVAAQKQQLGFRPAENDKIASKSQPLEFFDDVLPSCATLEVLTPPPIFAA